MSSLASKVAQLETAKAERAQAEEKLLRLQHEIAVELGLVVPGTKTSTYLKIGPVPGAAKGLSAVYSAIKKPAPSPTEKAQPKKGRRLPRITPELEAEIMRLTAEGKSIREIVKVTGLSKAAVWRVRHRSGKPKRKGPSDPAVVADVLQRLHKGETYQVIEKEAGISAPSISMIKKSARPSGRISKFPPDLIAKIAAGPAAGQTTNEHRKSLGVPKGTYYRFYRPKAKAVVAPTPAAAATG